MRVVLVCCRKVPELAGFGIGDHERRRGTEVRTHPAVRPEVFREREYRSAYDKSSLHE